MRLCKACNEVRPESEYYSHPKGKDGLYSYCKPCARTKALDYAKRNGKTTKRPLQALGDSCDVCGRTTDLCRDHDHYTDIDRGTLCRTCNSALGLLKDSPSVVFNLYSYIVSHLPGYETQYD